MTRRTGPVLLSCATAAVLALAMPAWGLHGGEGMPGTQWGEPPPVLPKGSKVAVLMGDPGKPGPFVMRLSAPAGYKVAPHWHSQAENVTVISGTVMIGMGDKFDLKAMKTMKAGSFGSIPAKEHHFAYMKTATVIQIHGEGPFDLTYINPEDDPQKGAAAPK